MINLTVATNEARKTVIVEDVNQPVKEILAANEVVLTSQTVVYLNGNILDNNDIHDSLIDLEILDGGTALLTTVVKATANK